MAENKHKPTTDSVDAYIAAIADEDRRKDCAALILLMAKASGYPPHMYGTAIVGFGVYHYKYDSGREGDACLVGFALRKGDISLYLSSDYPKRDALMAKLGKHKAAKACVYVKRLDDIDAKVLEQMVATSAAATRKRYP